MKSPAAPKADILRRCGRNICQQGRAKSWAILEIKRGRARNRVLETGDQYNTDHWPDLNLGGNAT